VDALRLHPDVERALHDRRPVVALESTVITHGLPGAAGRAASQAVEDQVRQCGATPATIAVIAGRIHVGLSDADLSRLVRDDAEKASSRDLPLCVALGRTASTTVGATCVIAEHVGIEVFATGGIGGVHRDAAHTFDESSDLVDLARTGRVVVSAGIKSVLDVPATLERLETLGVPVIGVGTDDVPGFWARSSGVAVPWRVDSVPAIAAIVRARSGLGLESRSIAVMRPVDDADALDQADHDIWIGQALEAAEAAGVTGAAVTPFILDHVHERSAGASVQANVSLLRGNGALAAQIAVALSPA
jgi:pseudouridine-5'-phosphate glycosidase